MARSAVANLRSSKGRAYLFGVCGVDLTRIDGIDTTTALKLVAEVGPDLSRFKSAKHFASCLGLCPGTKISGGKLLCGATKRTANRAAQALKLAAAALRSSHSASGAYFRRMASRLDRAKAITATAHKLAHLVYTAMSVIKGSTGARSRGALWRGSAFFQGEGRTTRTYLRCGGYARPSKTPMRGGLASARQGKGNPSAPKLY